MRQCLLVFCLAIVVDVISSIHTCSLVAGNAWMATSTVVASWYLMMFNLGQYADTHTKAKRLWIVTAIALGAGVGSALVVLLKIGAC